MTDLEQEIAHLQELQAKHRQNIRTLEEMLADYGMDRPLKLVNELDALQQERENIEEWRKEIDELAESVIREFDSLSTT